jgi:hypothetical protein
LPVLTDPVAALHPDACPLHPDPFRFPYRERDLRSNVLLEYRLVDGDLAAGFAQADVVVEHPIAPSRRNTPICSLKRGWPGVRPDGRIEVVCPGQWMHEERERDRPRAWPAPTSGLLCATVQSAVPLGAREDISLQIVLALAAWEEQDARSRPPGAGQKASSATTNATRTRSGRAGGPPVRGRSWLPRWI